MQSLRYIIISVLIILGLYLLLQFADSTSEKQTSRTLSTAFKSYWFSGKAELSTYELKQARYGEYRNGKAVLIFVTEPFLKNRQLKADQADHNSQPVLKLNSTREFHTGIYPYHILSSIFYPLSKKQNAIKITNTVTEWCGQSYAQLNNRSAAYQLRSHSYFETMGDLEKFLPKNILEDQLWTLIRVDPNELPLGERRVIPSFSYLRLKHQEYKAYSAHLSIEQSDSLQHYTILYPELNRKLTIHFQKKFPHIIESWEETYASGFGKDQKLMTTTASRIQTIKSSYWAKNSNADVSLRDTLGL